MKIKVNEDETASLLRFLMGYIKFLILAQAFILFDYTSSQTLCSWTQRPKVKGNVKAAGSSNSSRVYFFPDILYFCFPCWSLQKYVWKFFLFCFVLLIKMKNKKPCVLKHVETKLFYILFNIYRFTKKKISIPTFSRY